MPKIKVEMRKSDVIKIKAQLQRLESSLRFSFNDGVTKQLAAKAAKELQNNITTRHFASSYKPLNKNYAKWKRDEGFGNKFWRKTGELFSAITRWKQSGKINSWIAGIPSGIRNSDGEEIAEYAKDNEFGRGNIPKRSLFRKTVKEIDPNPSKVNPVTGWAKIAWVASVSSIIKAIWR